jgi:hypothetical protein
VAISITGKKVISLELAKEVLGLMGLAESSGQESVAQAMATPTAQREPLIEELSK